MQTVKFYDYDEFALFLEGFGRLVQPAIMQATLKIALAGFAAPSNWYSLLNNGVIQLRIGPTWGSVFRLTEMSPDAQTDLQRRVLIRLYCLIQGNELIILTAYDKARDSRRSVQRQHIDIALARAKELS